MQIRVGRSEQVMVALVTVLILSAVAAPKEDQQGSEPCKLIVKGTVVDEQGKPDGDAMVTALSDEDGVDRWGGAFTFGLTDADGHFSAEYNGDCTPLPDYVYLFVANKSPLMRATEPPGSKRPQRLMSPPFQRSYVKLGPRFRGIPVAVKGRRDVIDAGAVTVRLRYGEILLKLLDPSGKRLLSSEIDALGLPLFWLRVRDEHGRPTHEGSVALRAILPEESGVWLALPEGRWKVQLFEGDFASKGEWVEATAGRRNVVEMILTHRALRRPLPKLPRARSSGRVAQIGVRRERARAGFQPGATAHLLARGSRAGATGHCAVLETRWRAGDCDVTGRSGSRASVGAPKAERLPAAPGSDRQESGPV